MQITHLHIQNFKGITQLDIPFLEEGTTQPRPLTMLLGDNGSGKTTVLQAIALTLSLATRQTAEPSTFGWTGFMAERVSSRGPTRVELDVRFEPDELAATQELFQQWLQAGSPGEHAALSPPTHHSQVKLVYASGGLSSPQGPGALSQFLGRFFISALSQTQAHIRSTYLARVGSTYWFDQHRNLRAIGYGKLREYLVGWWGFHTSPRKTEASDYLTRLQTRFLTPVLVTAALRVVVEKGGPKGSLPPKARDARQKGVLACYLRDRDFDFDPPADLARPTEDRLVDNPRNVLGWRWCRHELESYLLEPRLVASATGWDETAFSIDLQKAAQHIRAYTAARWAVGTARRGMPPTSDLPTRPDDLQNEIKLPADCSDTACFDWARNHVEVFRQKIEPALASTTITTSLAERSQRLAALTSIEDVLVWHSGKDLLAALAPSIAQRPEHNPVTFRRRLRDWVRDNPAAAVALFPEWQALLERLGA